MSKENRFKDFDPITCSNNIRRVESFLGHTIPSGMSSIEDLGRPMSGEEIQTYANNIRCTESFYRENSSSSESSPLSSVLISLVFGVLGIWSGIDFLSSSEIFLGLLVLGVGLTSIYSLIKLFKK